jgi:hypothetical protein
MTDDEVQALLNREGDHTDQSLYGAAEDLARALLEARAENARLREALTPSGDTKAAYMGEIKDPETKRMVSWTAIKMVMAMIAKRAALATASATPGDGGEG